MLPVHKGGSAKNKHRGELPVTQASPSLSSTPIPAIAATSADRTRRSVLAHVGAGIGSALLATGTPWIARAATTVWPIPDWPLALPESVGLNKAKLLEAQAFATKFAGGAGCVIRHGKLVHSWGVLKQQYPINSATKSWGSVVLGFALDEARFSLPAKCRAMLPNLGYKPTQMQQRMARRHQLRVAGDAHCGLRRTRELRPSDRQAGHKYHLQRLRRQLAGERPDQRLSSGPSRCSRRRGCSGPWG